MAISGQDRKYAPIDTGFAGSPPHHLVPFLSAVATWSCDPARAVPFGADLALFRDAAIREVHRRFRRGTVPDVVDLVTRLLVRADDPACGEAEREVLRPIILAGQRELFERVRNLVEADDGLLPEDTLLGFIRGTGFVGRPRPVADPAPPGQAFGFRRPSKAAPTRIGFVNGKAVAR